MLQGSSGSSKTFSDSSGSSGFTAQGFMAGWLLALAVRWNPQLDDPSSNHAALLKVPGFDSGARRAMIPFERSGALPACIAVSTFPLSNSILFFAAAADPAFTAQLWDFFGRFHPFVVHFPIVLLCLAALGVFLPCERFGTIGELPYACLVIGSMAAIAAVFTGSSLSPQHGHGDVFSGMDSSGFWHRWTGVATMLFAVGLCTVFHRGQRLQRVGTLTLAALVLWTGHQGALLTFGEDFYREPFKTTATTAAPTSQVADKTSTSQTSEPIDFASDIAPILEQKCIGCHGPRKAKAKLQMHTRELFFKGGKTTQKSPAESPIVTPGNPTPTANKNRLLYAFLSNDEDERMPPADDADSVPISPQEFARFQAWILEGALWPQGHVLRAPR